MIGLWRSETEGAKFWLYELMSCLVFAAFKHEAFINHLGYALLPNWSELERERHSDKQSAILMQLGLSIDI